MMDEKKCLHPTCTCSALPMQNYCCDECKLADMREKDGSEPMGECMCNHPDCGGVPQVSNEAESLLMGSAVLAEA